MAAPESSSASLSRRPELGARRPRQRARSFGATSAANRSAPSVLGKSRKRGMTCRTPTATYSAGYSASRSGVPTSEFSVRRSRNMR
jgi:hypothetical protein